MAPRSYALFSALYPPHMGGVERFTANVARLLAARGNAVTVVTNDTEGQGAGEKDEDGVSVVRLPCHPLVSGRMPLPRPCALRSRLLREVSSRRFDGVLVNARFYAHSITGLRLARAQGLCPVLLDHGSAYLSMGSPALDWLVRRYEDGVTALGRRYDPAYFGISERSAAWLGHFGIEARGVIPNAIDAAAYRAQASARDFRAELGLSAETLLVAFVGRLVAEKGVRQLLDAARDARLAGRDVVFVLAGEGPLALEVAGAAAATPDHVRWAGALGVPDVAALLLQADALCLPTRSEGFSTVLLEAAACGCSPIVTDVGGAREVVAGPEFGRIIASMSADEVVRAVMELDDDRSLVSLRSRNCRERAELFSWNRTVDALERALLTS
ncbi:glycosyltransferase family 4 protein [Thermophilibacter provencensis]|uniref:Glycosyltransferase family 4 protein n=1 Tax=Thermophilibacter provencensis TaxID=1852386 RepID=A0ABT7V1J2_9ACTN|nr:glycosyltransferase family 4 protein [Thermophilibacter provencensis]MDM8270472.1 glycosyltransferase family 4 protein [Thermophilibacter provencensis]